MEKGLVLIYTGDGKGKTTAALGLCMRAIGWGKQTVIIQFLKSPDTPCGEKLFCAQHDILLYSTGIGFSWKKTKKEQQVALADGWALAKQFLCDPAYDLVVLDEIFGALYTKSFAVEEVLTENDVLTVLKNRPPHQHVVLTGRNAGAAFLDYADLVTEMKAIKHPFENGQAAQKGIEF